MGNINFSELEEKIRKKKGTLLMIGGKDLFDKNRGRKRSREDIICLLAAGYLKAREYPVKRNRKGEMILPLLCIEEQDSSRE